MLSNFQIKLLKFMYNKPRTLEEVALHMKVDDDILNYNAMQIQEYYDLYDTKPYSYIASPLGQAVVEKKKKETFDKWLTRGIAMAALVISIVALFLS